MSLQCDFKICEPIRTDRRTHHLSGRRVPNFFTHGTPVNRSRPRIVESGDCGCLRHFDFCRFARRFLRARRACASITPTHPAANRRATIMSQQSSAIVAQPSSSAKAPKRSATPRGRDAAAKKTKGLEHKLPCSCLDQYTTFPISLTLAPSSIFASGPAP